MDNTLILMLVAFIMGMVLGIILVRPSYTSMR